MTIEEAQICAELFVENKKEKLSSRTIKGVCSLLKEACKLFPETIREIDPNNMGKLFRFFHAIIVRASIKKIGEEPTRESLYNIGLDMDAVIQEFREVFYTDADDNQWLSPNEEIIRQLVNEIERR